MVETSNQIEGQILYEREQLGANLQELERKVKSATDWRVQFARHPMAMIGAAFSGGVLLATMMNGRKRKHYAQYCAINPARG
jgi:hypothetical protein